MTTKDRKFPKLRLRFTPWLIRKLRWLFGFRATAAGRYMFMGWAVSAAFGISVSVMPVYLLVCAWTSVAMMALVWGKLLTPKMSLDGDFPVKAAAGQPFTAIYTLRNTARRTGYDLQLAFPKLPRELRRDASRHQLPELAPGESDRLEITLEPLRRGHYELPPLYACSTFPFGLYRTPIDQQAIDHALIVLPSFEPLEGIDMPLGTRYQPGGIALTSNIGESPEYIGNREYRPGDVPRHIDFKSWARLAKPVVREYQEEYYHRIALVVDTYVKKDTRTIWHERIMGVPPKGYPVLEAGVSLSASIADALARGEYILDIFAAGPELYVFRAGRHTAHFENVLEILACVDACHKDPFEIIAPPLEEELANISTVVCVLLDWDASREKLLRTAVEMGCSTKVIIIHDGPTTLPLDSAEEMADQVTVFTPDQVQEGGLGWL